jgi:putative transposase
VYPNKTVQDEIFRQFNICTDLRNDCLDRRNFNVRVLPGLKKVKPELNGVHSVVLQNMLFQVRDNIKALSKLKAKGRRVGQLRHKPVRSLIYEQTGFRIRGNKIWFSKIGEMPISISRPVPGKIKQIVLKFTKTHRWFVSVISRDEDDPEHCSGERTVGIDMNLMNFSTDSDGKVFAHPHNVRKAAKQLGRAQRKMSRKVKGSHNRRKQRLRVAKVYETVNNRRDDFLHKWSNYYIENYDRIAVEKLNIKEMLEQKRPRGMTRKVFRGKHRNTLDAAWGKARDFLTYKAERAGCQVCAVEPAYTTQDCYRCGTRVPKNESERTHRCPVCGYTENRDLNAALNIRKRAFGIGLGTPEFTPVEIGTATPVSALGQVPVGEAVCSSRVPGTSR